MRESRSYGSVRGAASDDCPYRDPAWRRHGAGVGLARSVPGFLARQLGEGQAIPAREGLAK